FFQAEDGIRDFHVTGVQTCALPILALGQAFKAGAFDLADVNEHVLTAFIALDEAESLLGVEELDLALAGADNLRRHSAATCAAEIGRASCRGRGDNAWGAQAQNR